MNISSYEDIQDGKAYKKLATAGMPLEDEHLPPKLRAKYMLLVGLWSDIKKPDMNSFFKFFVHQFNQLSTAGMKIYNYGREFIIKAVVLLGTADSPARSDLLGMKRYNARYGCMYCEDPTKRVGRVRKYVISRKVPAPRRPPPSQNPSGLTCPFANQSMEDMPMPMPMPMMMPMPTHPNQPGIYPYLTTPYPAQSTPYPNNSPTHSSQPLQSSDCSQAISQTPQQAHPPRTSQTSDQEHCSAVPKPIAQISPIDPIYTVQPTAPPVSPQSNSEYNYAPPNNYHTPASSHQVTPLITNTQFDDKLTPTVVHDSNFDASKDAEVLRKAMKGFETDKKAIISILSNRNNKHRQNIKNSLATLHGRDIINELRSKLSGRFKDLIVAMMTPIIDYYVKEIHDSISGIGTDKDVLIIILCTLSNQDIHQICASYKNKYGKSLESDIRSNISGHLKTLLVLMCDGQRDESKETDTKNAKSDAKRLHSAVSCHLGTNEFDLNFIFAQRNVHQLRLIFLEYSKLYGHDISTAIDHEFSGNIEKALLTIVKWVKNSALYFAEQLNDSMSEIETKDQKLIFICVTRSEVDMGDIKEAFYQKYEKTLEKRISKDTSGDYEKCLIELISLNPRNYYPYYYWIAIFLITCSFLIELIS
ncbi:annexin A7-like [Aphidius gifuensis]|uniref:annexin A7-like n=1 Tax=Aphidius gifuensis TaxID=684658 RepID=UPI001CDD12EC|nr:annexin A7-like [Aphidius gifuensis]